MAQKDKDLAAAWSAMSKLVLDYDRKAAASEALGLSFARIRTLRRLSGEPQTLRGLAKALLADPPYVTLIVDDLEKQGLVKRTPHPDDRRAKLVQLTAAGRAAAAQADEIMNQPPAELSDLPAKDLATLAEVFERITPDPG
jgi:DNA-binding MarR family transcriptional regulator